MEAQSDGRNDEMTAAKEMRQQLESRAATVHNAQLDLIASLQNIVPNIVSSIDLSLKAISCFSGRPFIPLPDTLSANPNPNIRAPKFPSSDPVIANANNIRGKPSPEASRLENEKMVIDESGGALSVVRAMVAVCLLERVPFTPIDSSTVLRKLENDQSATAAERAALRELGGESGAILAVEMALKSMADDNGGVELEEFVVHFRRIIAAHTDVNLGDCSFLDTCRHMKTCKYVHYELDSTPDMSHHMMGPGGIPPSKPSQKRAHYCSEVELGEPQWINCDIRSFRMDILGQFGIIMADPPWDIHMELPYGTMADDEMRTLNVPALQTDGLIFLWVTGRAMELGRECLELWGYKRIEEIIWVKTNQLQRIIRTGRTGHWLNHSKEHCLVGIKGNPDVNRNIDTDVIVAEVRETSRKPDEMYAMLERVSPRTRKLELFARMHNVHGGWLSLGNQLQGVRLVDEGLRARFKAAFPDVEVQPPSPPRAAAMEVDPPSAQITEPS